jgi:hypothetical protein
MKMLFINLLFLHNEDTNVFDPADYDFFTVLRRFSGRVPLKHPSVSVVKFLSSEFWLPEQKADQVAGC